MKQDFWIEKWQNKQTGFHKSFVHPLLQQFCNKLSLKKSDEIFVPLCGKSLDMIWLHEQGYKVIGVELSQLAVEQFFLENKLDFERHDSGEFSVYTHKNISIYQGDFFKLKPSFLKNCHAIYDRAALIALPDEMVENYVKKLQEIIPENSKELLITLEFIKTTGPLGPPFSTPDAKVKKLFNNNHSMKLLYEEDIISREQRFAEMGCEYLWERVYLLTSKKKRNKIPLF